MFGESESEEPELTAELAALERQLAGLSPLPPQFDRDRLMFEAGRAAGRAGSQSLAATLQVSGASHWFWPAATTTMTAATVMLSAMLVWQVVPPLVAQVDDKPPFQNSPLTMGGAGEGWDLAKESASPQSSPKGTLDTEIWAWSSPPASGYVALRNLALLRGVGAIEGPALSANGRFNSTFDAQPTPPPTVRELLHELLPQTAQTANTSS